MFKSKGDRDTKVDRRRVRDGVEIPYHKETYMLWYVYSQYLNTNGLVIKREPNGRKVKKKDFGKLNKTVSKDWGLKPIGTSKRKIRHPTDLYLSGFDEWWNDNWKELFGEREIGFVRSVNSIPKKPDKNTIYIEVPLDTSSQVLRSKCKEIIDEEMIDRNIKINTKPISTSKYKPDTSSNIIYRVWIRKLCTKILHDQGIPNSDIYDKISELNVGEIQKTRTSDGSNWKKGDKYYSGGVCMYDTVKDKDSFYIWREVSRDYTECEVLLKDVKNGLFGFRNLKERSKTKNLFSTKTSLDFSTKKKKKK
jgi:hypothetical protein